MPRYELGASREIAVVLGLKDSPGHPSSQPAQDEVARVSRLLKLLQSTKITQSRDLVMANFCALYLPAVINRCLVAPNPDPKLPLSLPVQAETMLYNAYTEMLLHVFATPHFAKYIRSQAFVPISTRMLTATLAWRLHISCLTWDRHLRSRPDHWSENVLEGSPLVRILILVFQLIVATTDKKSQEEIVTSSLKNKLLPWVSKWASQYPPTVPLGDYSARLRKIFSNAGMNSKELKGFKAKIEEFEGWDNCAFSGCTLPRGSVKDLKACSRCHTVRYCSNVHQKEDWKYSHKYYCFETDEY